MSSFCRITGRARNLPKSHYFPMTASYTASDLRRFCRITGKSYGLPPHHFQPIVLKKKTKKCKNGKFILAGHRDPNYGIRKHKIISSQRYVEADLDSAEELRALLDEILNGEEIDLEEKDKRYVYKIDEHKTHIIINGRMEAAIRSGAIQDIMFGKDGITIVLKTREGQLIPLDLKQLKGRAIGELFEGEGLQEEESIEVELGRVTEHLSKASLLNKIARSVINSFPEIKQVSGANPKQLQKQLKQIMKDEKYSGLLINFIDNCVEKIVKGAERQGHPINGITKKAHRDEKILKILTMIFDNPKNGFLESQRLATIQQEDTLDTEKINGTTARYTPGTLDYIIANVNTSDPNETVMNILQLGIQTFLKEISSLSPPKSKSTGNGLVPHQNGKNGYHPTPEYYQEFLEQTMGLINCLTRSCGEIQCYGANVQQILSDFIHANAKRCNFRTPEVEMVKEIHVPNNFPLFYTNDTQELEEFLIRYKDLCRDTALVIKDGIKVIMPKAMLKHYGCKNVSVVLLDDDECIQIVLDAIKDNDEELLEGNEDGIVDAKSYRSKRPRRQSGNDTRTVISEWNLNGARKKQKKRQANTVANPMWKNVYKKYKIINDAIYMFRAYVHQMPLDGGRFTRY